MQTAALPPSTSNVSATMATRRGSTTAGIKVGVATSAVAAASVAATGPLCVVDGTKMTGNTPQPKYEVPADIYNDILYCQKALRTHIKVHQRLASTVLMANEETDERLQYIESEMASIGADQHTTLNRLRVSIDLYIDRMAAQNFTMHRPDINFRIGTELTNRLNSVHNIEPIRVQRRHTEADLVRRLRLQHTVDYLSDPLVIGEQPYPRRDCAIIPAAQPAVTITAIPKSATTTDFAQSSNGAERTERIEVLLNPSDITANVASAASSSATQAPSPSTAAAASAGRQQVSLLKPRAERILHSATSPSTTTEAMLATMLPGVTVTPVGSPRVLPPVVVTAAAVPRPSVMNVTVSPIASNTGVSAEATAAAAAATMASTPSPAMNNRRMNLLNVLKMAKHRNVVASAKASATSASSINDTTPSGEPSPTSVNSTTTTAPIVNRAPRSQRPSSSRSVSPVASNSSSSSDEQSSSSASSNDADATYTPGPKPARKSTKRNRSKPPKPSASVVSSQPKRARKSPTPPAPNTSPPPAPLALAPLPVGNELMPDEMSLETFLRLFDLCTPDIAEEVVRRSSERRRRAVTSTEKGDFLYGSFDLFEQQQRRVSSKPSNKRPVLYTPPKTRRGRKPALATAPTAVANVADGVLVAAAVPATQPAVRKTYGNNRNAAKRSASAASAEANPVAAVEEQEASMCVSCTTTTKERTHECTACNAFYHMSCHNAANVLSQSLLAASGQPAGDRERYCPDCLRRRLTKLGAADQMAGKGLPATSAQRRGK